MKTAKERFRSLEDVLFKAHVDGESRAETKTSGAQD